MGYFLQPTIAPARPIPWPRLPAPVDNSGETAENEVPEFFTVNSGRRFYSPELGRWLSRDPIGEEGFEIAGSRQKTQSEIEREAEGELYALIFQVDAALAARLGLRPWVPQHHLYPFVINNPFNQFDPDGLSCFAKCWRKCIKDNYGRSFDVAFDLSLLALLNAGNAIKELYYGIAEEVAKETLKDLTVEAALTEGKIIDKLAVAERAAKTAKSLSAWTKVLSGLAKGANIVSAAATGYVFGASAYCTGQCLAE